MHCADQGVGSDFLGNLFAYLVAYKMPGTSRLERCRALGRHVDAFYEENDVEDRLKEILPKSFQSEKKKTRPPKLKGNAATTRALIGFGDLIAKQFLSDGDPMEAAMKGAAHHLKNCYESLHEANQAFSHTALYNSSKAFALQYGALHLASGGGVSWKPMPI